MDSIEALAKINESLSYGTAVIDFSPTDIEGECASHVQEIARLRNSKIPEEALSATISCLNNGSGLGYVGLISASLGYWMASINAYEKALFIFEKLGDAHIVAKTHGNLGSVYAGMGKWSKAIDYYQKSLEIFEELDDVHGIAQIYNNLGLVYAGMGKWPKAIEHYLESLETKETLSDVRAVAKTYNNLGLVYAGMGKWSKAIEYYQKDMEISEKLGDMRAIAKTYNNLGLVCAGMGKWPKAIEYYQKSLEIFEELGDVHGVAQTYVNLGLVYAGMGKWPKAIEYYQKSLEIFEELGDVQGKGIPLSNLGKLYLDKDEPEPDKARKHLEDSIKRLNEESRPHYPNAVNWLASCYHRIGIIKKGQAKKENGDKIKEELVDSAARLFSDASKLYHELIYLPRVDVPSLKVYYHLDKGLSYSVINITEKDNKIAINSLDKALKEFKKALKFADYKEKLRVQGIISEYKAKRYIRRVLSEKSSKKQEKLIGKAIKSLGDSVDKFKKSGEVEHCNVKTCEGCMHLFKALRLFRKGIKEYSKSGKRDKLSKSEFELAEARKCYENAVNELGTDTIQILDKSFKHVEEMIKNKDEKLITDATKEFITIIEELSSGSLQSMVRIFTFDESMKVPERESENKPEDSKTSVPNLIAYAGLIGPTIVSGIFYIDYAYYDIIPVINITDITNLIYAPVASLLFLIFLIIIWLKKRIGTLM